MTRGNSIPGERTHPADSIAFERGPEHRHAVARAVEYELEQEWTRYLGQAGRRTVRRLGTALLQGIEQALRDFEQGGYELEPAPRVGGPWAEVLEHALGEAEGG